VISIRPIRWLLRSDQTIHLVHQFLERVDLVGCGALGGQSAGLHFDQASDVVDLFDVRRRHAHHECAAVRLAADQALMFESSQRLADGHAADTELLGQLWLLQMHAWRESAKHDRPPQAGRDAVGKGHGLRQLRSEVVEHCECTGRERGCEDTGYNPPRQAACASLSSRL
jgi:hypothetical protein